MAQPGGGRLASGPGSLATAGNAINSEPGRPGRSQLPPLRVPFRIPSSPTSPEALPCPPDSPPPACLPVPCAQGAGASQGRERDAGWRSVKELIEK